MVGRVGFPISIRVRLGYNEHQSPTPLGPAPVERTRSKK